MGTVGMPPTFTESERQQHAVQRWLEQGVFEGNLSAVEAAIGAGADANGDPYHSFAPIVMATLGNHPRIANALLENGADPDRPVTASSVPDVDPELPLSMLGERALHMAARSGKVEIVRLLLRSCANPNATDSKGRTPLIVSCSPPECCVEVVRLLLDAGADPTLAQEDGFIPLHAVAADGHMDLVDMLHSREPSTLNRCASIGRTPLFEACLYGHESMVSKLLSLGAMQPFPLEQGGTCPLSTAVDEGYEGVVRVLISEGGMRAVGGDPAVANALYKTICVRQPTILQLLLGADGEEIRWEWANANIDGRRLLHYGAGYCYPAAVSILLGAGADEATLDLDGRIPRDVIGVDIGIDDVEVQMDRGKEVAIRRMLQRGPAYRARSWAWPSDEEADAGDGGDDDPTTGAAGSSADGAGAAGAAVLSSPPAVPKTPVTGLRIFRRREKNSSSNFFVGLVGRYCDK